MPIFVAACGEDPAVLSGEDGDRAPSAATVAAQAEVAKGLALDDRGDFEDAERGLVARDPELRILRDDGHVVWEARANDFIDGPAPPSVNPSLWRQAKLNKLHGLYRVIDGIYQVRGYDISNLTLIRGRTGWIVVDPLTSRETAAAAMALARKHIGPAPVTAIVFTHSHVDHFGGIDGVLTESERANVPIVAPKGFLEEATSENVLAGITMGRRAGFMYGIHLERSPTGHVDTGLGQAPARGTIAIAKPTARDRSDSARNVARRRALRVPVHARIRSAGGDDVLSPRAPCVLRCRDRLADSAQSLHATRRQGARRARVERLHRPSSPLVR